MQHLLFKVRNIWHNKKWTKKELKRIKFDTILSIEMDLVFTPYVI